MSTRNISVAVGVLFIAQMLTAMVGTALLDGNPSQTMMAVSALFMSLSAVSVLVIGVLAYQVLKPFNQRLAIWYPIMRGVEFAVSMFCSIYLLTQLQAVPDHMLWIYVPTAIGGLIFTYLLIRSGVVHKAVAWLGLIGYSLFGLGTVLDFANVVDLNGSGIAMLVPGLMFELIVLPYWLIRRRHGFKLTQTTARQQ
jgi:hypothetical protein